MWFKISSFFKFLLQSKGKHSIHSPFVFNLVTQCFSAKIDSHKKQTFKNAQKWLQKNHSVITVNDFGEGSKVFKTKNRKVSQIATIASITSKKAYLLIKLIEYLNCNHILEIGTSVGLSAAAMRIANYKANIQSLEGCEQTAAIAQNLFENCNLKPIEIIVGSFDKTLQNKVENKQYDLIYFDGNHNKNATLSYFNQCLNSVHNNSVFIFDDIHWSKDMLECWNEIKSNHMVTLSINMYFWGIVFFRKEQVKQHFNIRF